jgi:hypothetical protein
MVPSLSIIIMIVSTICVVSYSIPSRRRIQLTTRTTIDDYDHRGLVKTISRPDDIRRRRRRSSSSSSKIFPWHKQYQCTLRSVQFERNDEDHEYPCQQQSSSIGSYSWIKDDDHPDHICQLDTNRRRYVTRFVVKSVVTSIVMMMGTCQPGYGAITDETDTFANNWWTSPSIKNLDTTMTTSTMPTPSDEISITVNKKEYRKENGLGIELADIEFKTNLRVYVKSVKTNSYGEQLGIQKDWIFIGINQQSMERTNTKGVATFLNQAISQNNNNNNIILRFRDPSIFRNKLQSLQENHYDTNSTGR